MTIFLEVSVLGISHIPITTPPKKPQFKHVRIAKVLMDWSIALRQERCF